MSKAYPVRRRPRADGRGDRRRRRALPPLRRLGRAQARHRARRHRSRRRSRRSSSSITSPNKTDCSTCWARPLCSGGCYHEAHTRYGDTDAGRTCTTATGSAAGPTSACRSTASCPSAIPAFLAQFDDDDAGRTGELTRESDMKHLKADQPQGGARRDRAPSAAAAAPAERRRRAAARRPAAAARCRRTSRSAARWCSRRAGRRIAPAAPPDCASRSSAICSTATSAATGRRRCPTSSITRRTGPAKCAAAQKDWRKIDLVFP